MADAVFNISKGAFIEMIRDTGSKTLVLLLETGEADATLNDYDDVGAMLAGAPIEAAFTNYARKVDITEILDVDDTNDETDVDIPDQTFTSAGNGTNETLAKLVTAYENAAADATRICMSHHEFVVTTDGSDLTAQINAAGIMRAA